MKNTFVGFFLFAAVLIWQSCAEKPGDVFSGMNWLLGTWEVNEGQYFEKWIRKNKNTFLSTSFRIDGQDTVILETIELVQKEGHIYYIPTVKDQNEGQPVSFKMTSTDPIHLVFENPEHDFPKRIGYDKMDDKNIKAWIDGDGKQMDFSFKKVK